MTNRIATTREQSDRLLKCGVPAESADMFLWVNSYGQEFLETHYVPSPAVSITPAWSLSALLGLLFKSGHILSMQYEHNEYRLQSFYSSGDFVTYGLTGIEACVNMIEQLTANGYKLNGIEEGGSEQ